jgi:hypothetical protein
MSISRILQFSVVYFLLIFAHNNLISQTDINWAESFGSNSDDKIFAVIQDGSNNSYITGSFSQTADFGDISIESRSETDIFLAKINPAGKCLWAIGIGGSKSEYGKSLAIDDDGNILLAANFYSDTLYVNEHHYVLNSGNQDFLIAKFNSFGELLWARGFGYLEYDNVSAIDIGNYGNIYITGMFTYHLDLGNNITLASNGGMDIFVAKLDQNGYITWAGSIGSYSSLEFSNDIACNADGSAIIIGRYNGTISFPNDVDDLTSRGSSDIFLSKFGNTGQCQWASSFGGSGSDHGVSLDISNTGMIYTTGYFPGTIILDDDISLYSTGSTDVFIAKHDTDGNPIWAKKAGSLESDGVYEISVNDNSHASICGYFSGSMVFDANNYFNSVAQTDAFFATYDSSGVCQYAKAIVGSGSNEATSIFSNDRTVIAGNFTNSIEANTFELESNGSTDIFLLMNSSNYPSLSIPELISPEENETGVATSSTFSWGAVDDANDYHLQISTFHNFSNTARDVENIASTFYEVTGLSDNRIYYWRVKARNAEAESFWSETQRFITGESTPEQVSLTSPANDALLNTFPILDWEKSDGAFSYTVQLSTTQDMSGLLLQYDGIADDQLPIYNLEYGQTYYWRIRAENLQNSSEWSDVWQFTLEKQFPKAPDLLLPLNDSENEQEVTLTWEDVTNSTGYYLQVSNSAEFSSILLNDSTITDTEKTLLLGKSSYYWRVRARSGNINGFWQLPRRFSVNAPAIPFASSAGSVYKDEALDVCSDSLGNVYTVGYISGQTRFADDVIVSHNGSKDIFISRNNSKGECLWARSFGSNQTDIATSVIADNNGNIFFAGSFSGTVNFSDNITLVSNGSEDMFIAKADSSGNIIWAKQIGSIAPDRITDIDTYDFQNIFVSGFYSDTMVVSDDIDSLFSNGMTNIFVAKIDTSGIIDWAKGFGSDEFDEANGIAVDEGSTVYLTGFFSQNVGFDSFEIESVGEEDIFVTSLDTDGGVRWAKSAGSSTGIDNATSITVSDDGTSYLTGSFSGSIYFTESDSLVSNGLRDVFVASYDANGGHRWTFSGGGSGLVDTGEDIECASDGNIYLTGTYAFTSLFDNKALLKSFGSSDVFVLKMNSDGDILKAKAIGGNYEDFGYGIGVDKFSNVYACGSFKRTAYFNGISISSEGEEDIFMSMVFGFPETDLLLPENNETEVTLSPTLSWEAVTNAEKYELQIFTDSNYQQLRRSYTSISDTAYKVNNLSPVTDYYWRVRAKSDDMAAPWTNLFKFRTKFEVPVLISPENDSYSNLTDVELNWSNIRLADNYHLIVSTDAEFNNIIVDINDLEDNEYALNDLAFNTKHFWKVRASNNIYTGDWSDVWEFTTELQTPSLLSPANNSTRLNTELTLSWQQSVGAESYDVQVSEDQNFGSISIQNNSISTNSVSIQGLSPEKRYYWRVRANASDNHSQWTAPWSFTTYFNTPANWEFTENTGRSALVIVPVSANVKLRMRDIIAGDAIGLFYQDDDEIKCGGYGVWNEEALNITVWGDDTETDEKDGFSDDEDYVIMLWDAQAGEALEAEATFRSGDPDHFVEDETSYIFSIRTSGMQVQTIELRQGWNLISSYILPADQEIDMLLQPIRSNMLLAKNGDGDIYFPSLNINSIGNWEFTDGYSIYMTFADNLEVTGYPIVPEDNPIILSAGWNSISYLRNSEMNIEQVFTDIVDDILLVKNNDGEIYFPDLNINSIGQMNPGQGYKVYAYEETALQYQQNSSGRNASYHKQDYSSTIFDQQHKNTGNNFTMIILLDGLDNASEIAAINSSGRIVGSGKIIEGKSVITIWGDDIMTDIVDGCVEGEAFDLLIIDDSDDEIPYRINGLQKFDGQTGGLIYQTDGTTIATLSGTEFSDEISIIPNPARDEISIRFTDKTNTGYQLLITDMQGRTFLSNKVQKENSEINEYIDLKDFPSGKYNIIILSGTKTYRKNFVIIK